MRLLKTRKGHVTRYERQGLGKMISLVLSLNVILADDSANDVVVSPPLNRDKSCRGTRKSENCSPYRRRIKLKISFQCITEV
jgi:hypothetical protein